MTKLILMKFNILNKYLEDNKNGYLKFLVKLYFKVFYPTILNSLKFIHLVTLSDS